MWQGRDPDVEITTRDATQDIRVEGIQGAARGSSNIWPTDGEWK